jgi:hypothetical protein
MCIVGLPCQRDKKPRQILEFVQTHKKFDELDTDKDGTLDAKEIMAFFKKG